MALIDWIVLGGTLLFIVIYGAWRTRESKSVKDYIGGGQQARWWTIGLSVMATQASAITFLSTPGQAFHDGMGFVQFYFGLPIAMVIICAVFIPIYSRLKVFTAYEFLEKRFDLRVRKLTASLFLIQRGLSAGITIFAPSIILSAVLGWNLTALNILIGCLVIIYTVSGGTKAVNVTQKQQMAVIFSGMILALFFIVRALPESISFSDAIDIAGSSDKMEVLNFSFDLNNRYTVWTGLIGGTFLALSYFGTDQSQVQRYLSGKSVQEMRLGMLFNGLLKVPMQFFILFVGVMVFVFYQFNQAPLHFNPLSEQLIQNTPYETDYENLKNISTQNYQYRISLYQHFESSPSDDLKNRIADSQKADLANRDAARTLLEQAANSKKVSFESNDKDYVFIHFILNNLPRGLIGLLLAVILSAAMSSTASELNALGATTALDLYNTSYPADSDQQLVKTTKLFTIGWGILAIGVACVAYLADNLIQLVNIIGSIFYGNVLGIFLLAFFVKWVNAKSVLLAAIITQVLVIVAFRLDWMPYLWLNLLGCGLVMLLALLIEAVMPQNKS
ncbi:MAG: sodium:solute symporter [Bacteroidetes bacterium]|nr:sodium:solute symporter [Bacteroidota bacterium]MDA0879128.1 sodium:solute symporter [Bacteroidota bacterium]MDA1115592.1 sodium:solute symporter [Bacteroidota bacterium]